MYSSTKGSIETLTRAWAAEFRPRRRARQRHLTRRNPRPTPARTNSTDRSVAPMIRATLAGDAGTPTRSPTPPVYLAGDESALVHDTVIDVDGGRANIAAMTT